MFLRLDANWYFMTVVCLMLDTLISIYLERDEFKNGACACSLQMSLVRCDHHSLPVLGPSCRMEVHFPAWFIICV